MPSTVKMFSHLGLDIGIIPTLKNRVKIKYHHLYSFLYSSFASSVSPFFFKNMIRTTEFLIQGIEKKATFYILGDKDADGVSATSILKSYFESCECKVYYNTPLDNETYGSSPRIVQDILSKKEEIYAVLTVDTGIKENNLADILNIESIPFIITDHHTPDILPNTPYIINPHLNPESFLPICGAYVALKLVQALFLAQTSQYTQKALCVYYNPEKAQLLFTPIIPNIFIPCKEQIVLDTNNEKEFITFLEQTVSLITTAQTYEYLKQRYPQSFSGIKITYIAEELYQQYSPLLQQKKPKTFYPHAPTYGLLLFVAEFVQTQQLHIEKKLSLAIQIAGIATLCDRMPMNHFENRGIVKTAFTLFYQDKNHPLYSMVKAPTHLLDFTTNIIPMQFCPLLNAGGRLGKANLVIDFLASNLEERPTANQKLIELNRERQKKQRIGLQEVEHFLELEDIEKPYILYASENIHKGVTGIIANKLSRVHAKPVFILSIQKENSSIVGSARSPFPVHNILEGIQSKLIAFGGHQKACGFSLSMENLTLLENYLAEQEWNIQDINEDKEEILVIDIENCSSSFYKSVELLDPYGEEHQPPIFKTQSSILNPEVFGKNQKHIKWYPKKGMIGQFIFWNALDNYSLEELTGKEVWVTFTIQKNSFYNNRYDFFINSIEYI